MGRKSKLTPAQWMEAKKMAVGGMSPGSIAKHFGVARSTISEGISDSVAEIKNVATQVVNAEQALTSLPISDQLLTVDLAATLRSISMNMGKGSELGAKTFHRLSAIANGELQKVDDADPMSEKSLGALKNVAALTKMANDAASTPINLLAANKDTVKRLNEDGETPASTAPVFNITVSE